MLIANVECQNAIIYQALVKRPMYMTIAYTGFNFVKVVVYNVITGNSVKMYLIVHVKAHRAEMPLKCKDCG